MSEQKKSFMDEQDFDALLSRSLPELPPEDIVARTVPGKKALNRILIGYFLSTFTINGLGLNLILPVIGQILMLLGFRALQHENRWFSACYIFAVLQAFLRFGKLILDTTIFDLPFEDPQIAASAFYIALALQVLLSVVSLLCFWRGLRTVQKACGIRSKAIGVLALLVWNLLFCAMALLQMRGQFFGGYTLLFLLVSLIIILWMIARQAKALDATGYVLQPAPLRLSDRTLTLIILAILAIGCTCGHLFFSSYTMDWQKIDSTESAATSETKTHLAALGFPEDILDDLTPEDLARCRDAEQVVVDARTLNSENPSGVEQAVIDPTLRDSTIDNDPEDLLLTNVIVLVPGETPHVVLFNHFSWLSTPKFYGTAALNILPTYEASAELWRLEDGPTGRILYDDGDDSFVADYHSIEMRTVTSNLFRNVAPSPSLYASFIFPNQGTRQRGYITYTIAPRALLPEGYRQAGYSQMTYMHQKKRFLYPAETADSSSIFSINGPFESMQPAPLIFELTESGIKLDQ